MRGWVRAYASADLHDWRRGLGVFAVERFVEAEHLRKRTFEIPADFQIEEVLHGHSTQELKRVAGGRMRLSFTCTNLMPGVSWILQWGPHAKVIEPSELVAMVIDELEQASAQYAAAAGIAIDDKVGSGVAAKTSPAYAGSML